MLNKIFPFQKNEKSLNIINKLQYANYDEDGFRFLQHSQHSWSKLDLNSRQKAAYLQQLDEEGYLSVTDGSYLLIWASAYELLNSIEHKNSLPLLCLPPVLELIPLLASSNGLSDENFSVVIKAWRHPNLGDLTQLDRVGAIIDIDGSPHLLNAAAWQLLQSVRRFFGNQRANSDAQGNHLAWAEIRQLARTAKAIMDGFLSRTVVLRPETLQLKLSKSKLTTDPVIGIEPVFDNQPSNWLATFDAYRQVQDQYHIKSDDGTITHVLISPEVRSVLEVVRALPGRYIAGDEALAFIRNPYALLGDDAVKVLDEDIYLSQLSSAGIHFHHFVLETSFVDDGRIKQVDLVLQSLSEIQSPDIRIPFMTPNEFAPLVKELRAKVAAGMACGFWKGYELELSNFDHVQFKGLETLLAQWQKEAAGEVFDTMLDLSAYGDRVVGIGVAQKISSPFMVKEASEDWIPSEVLKMLGMDGDLVTRWDTANRSDFDEFCRRIQEAQQLGTEMVRLPALEIPLRVETAIRLRDIWKNKFNDTKTGESESAPDPKAVLLIEHNVEDMGYMATREDVLRLAHAANPDIPLALRPEITLREHQLKGLAWLQHLYSFSPSHISGCVLADDMGLGKTIQLLSFIVGLLEKDPDSPPVLIIAPVSLLDNWQRELERFFYIEDIPLLKLYGDALTDVKLKKAEIPASLLQKGIKNLLRPGWICDAKVVLTTYETLRDQEISLARQQWSVVVCDEAQKIKNPGALVTQAAKALPARFRVACTGTPVENSLTDLWCLFDFIQPGLLGALNEFGRKYQRPIESKSATEESAIKELSQLIEVQLLRRTKADVAKDLPKKIDSSDCKTLPMSRQQQAIYRDELANFEQRRQLMDVAGGQSAAVLGLLHTLKMICANPNSVRPSDDQIEDSPKMKWLVQQLHEIRKIGDKVIVFTELRDVQRSLQLTIQDHFGIYPRVINGDTAASGTRGITRQTLIDEFQEEPGFNVIILSTTAVGFGVNVQAANHVIHFTRCWNPAKEDQATDRAYRIGQTKDVYVYCPTVVSDEFKTFEMTLDGLLTKKRELAGNMLNGTGDINISEFELL